MQKAAFYIAKQGGYTLHMNVMFNPASYSVDSGADYTTVADAEKHTDTLQFAKTQARKLNVELYLDAMNGGNSLAQLSSATMKLKDIFASMSDDITPQLDQLHELIEPVKKMDGTIGTPPIVLFSWGSFSFTGVVTSLKENRTMFLRDGRPVKATVAVSMTEYIPPSAPKSAPAVSAAAALLDSSQQEDHSEAAKAAVNAVI